MSKANSPLTYDQRRQRREERRAKQREANSGRAAKMHAARLEFESGPPRLNIGCSGWFYWAWRGQFYPHELPTSNWFAHYAEQFNTVELNAPFYSWPTIHNVQSWLKQIDGKPFIYTVKACELITHVKKFARTAELVKDFYFIARVLGTRMGCFLFQLPPSFHYTPTRLKRIVDQLDPAYRNVIEFRHKSWWNKSVYRAFEKANLIFCSCSGPRLPDELVQTHDEVYLRFHGTKRWYRHDYSTDELAEWAKRVRKAKPQRVWAYFNNDRDCHSINNAKELLRQLREK